MVARDMRKKSASHTFALFSSQPAGYWGTGRGMVGALETGASFGSLVSFVSSSEIINGLLGASARASFASFTA